MEFKPLPIGIENFEEMITNEYYYVDKTLLIRDILDKKGKVSLFTRPRRFGKTLNLSMLRYYFEKSGKDNSHLFDGLKIAEAGEKYREKQGKYPVINLNLKSGRQPDFRTAYIMLRRNIAEEFDRHKGILESDILGQEDKERYMLIKAEKASYDDYADAARFLSNCLEKAYGEKAVILVDEYDVPLENAFYSGFYEEMISFVRSLFESALKTNDSLEFAVITGCLRISRESIFTGLNNLEIISIRNTQYAEHFGFTTDEVDAMLAYYGKIHHTETVRNWYDGYIFGSTEVYNPWSIINYMKKAVANDAELPMPYWSNTSSNSVIRDLVERADDTVRRELELLVEGGTIEKPVHEDITYADIYSSQNNLWNFLLFTGYMKKISERLEGEAIYITMAVPNLEIKSIYTRKIMEWFDSAIKTWDFRRLYTATLEGDTDIMEEELSKALMESISYYDSSEAFYHGFMTGIYKGMKGYIAESNMEIGNGRPDLVVRYPSIKGKAVILEFKATKDPQKMDEICDEALKQIQEKEYVKGMQAKGYKDIDAYGIGFYGKDCVARKL